MGYSDAGGRRFSFVMSGDGKLDGEKTEQSQREPHFSGKAGNGDDVHVLMESRAAMRRTVSGQRLQSERHRRLVLRHPLAFAWVGRPRRRYRRRRHRISVPYRAAQCRRFRHRFPRRQCRDRLSARPRDGRWRACLGLSRFRGARAASHSCASKTLCLRLSLGGHEQVLRARPLRHHLE